jgi:hypothetical protein
MYSRYLETQYIGWSNKIELVIVAFMSVIEKMGKPLMVQADDEFNTRQFKDFCIDNDIRFFFWKPYENPKNQLIERANLTIKRFMMKYIDKYGWPSSGDLADDAQQVLDACTWYYNRIWHKGINTIPFEVFFGYDDNRQNIVINDYPKIPIGSIVLRKPFRKLSNVPLTVYQVDPEPFTVIAYDGGKHVGKYQLKSLATDEIESRWYKPYELRVIPKNEYSALFNGPILTQFILSRHREEGLEQF